MRNPKFAILTDKAGQFRFNLKSGNGQTIIQSQGYKSRAGCQNGIESVKRNAADDTRYERKSSSNGEDYFVLKAANGEPLGRSEMYKSKAGMENGIAAVKRIASSAPVQEFV
jgi:uncharacterized protein YegP (UPF0339 family)